MRPQHSYLEKEFDNWSHFKKRNKTHVKAHWRHYTGKQHNGLQSTSALIQCWCEEKCLLFHPSPSSPHAGIPGQPPNQIQPALLTLCDLGTSLLRGLQGTKRIINTFLYLWKVVCLIHTLQNSVLVSWEWKASYNSSYGSPGNGL